METVISPLSSFILQVLVLLSFFPITFLAYRRLREPKKVKQAKWELAQFGLDDDAEIETAQNGMKYKLSEYLVPLTYIFLILLALYSMTNPFIIGLGTWKGLLEDIVDIFGPPANGLIIARDILVGRLMFWCWLGAYVYSVDRIIRHYLAQDLTPNVYVAVAKRFTVAFVVGTIVGIAVGLQDQHLLQLKFDANLTAVYVVCFFVGMFPENGIRWIRGAATRALRQSGEESEGISLAAIEGIGTWQEGRLDQEGIVNAQNLASASLLTLVAKTPFDVGQMVDWVDQAILIMNTSPEQLHALRKVGIRYGSVLISATEHGSETLGAATGLGLDEIKVMRAALYSATNMQLIMGYRRHLRRLEAHKPEAASPEEPEPFRVMDHQAVTITPPTVP